MKQSNSKSYFLLFWLFLGFLHGANSTTTLGEQDGVKSVVNFSSTPEKSEEGHQILEYQEKLLDTNLTRLVVQNVCTIKSCKERGRRRRSKLKNLGVKKSPQLSTGQGRQNSIYDVVDKPEPGYGGWDGYYQTADNDHQYVYYGVDKNGRRRIYHHHVTIAEDNTLSAHGLVALIAILAMGIYLYQIILVLTDSTVLIRHRTIGRELHHSMAIPQTNFLSSPYTPGENQAQTRSLAVRRRKNRKNNSTRNTD